MVSGLVQPTIFFRREPLEEDGESWEVEAGLSLDGEMDVCWVICSPPPPPPPAPKTGAISCVLFVAAAEPRGDKDKKKGRRK